MIDENEGLDRFIIAQQSTYARALRELQQGRKSSHWMWFIFPQIAGLGRSDMAQRYAITGSGEAQRYLAHPVLGHRLQECANALLAWSNRSAREILGSPDDMKLRSCMTLFAAVAPDNEVFRQVLDSFFDGRADERTIKLLANEDD